jgi:hypothetical protein
LGEENGSRIRMSGANGVADLEKKFRGCGYLFRHFESATCEILRWQAGRIEVERVVVPSHVATGNREVVLEVKKFHLVGFAATADELIERLGELPSAAPPCYHELIE